MAPTVEASVEELDPHRKRLRAALTDRLVASMPLAQRVFVLWLATRIGYVGVTYLTNTLHLLQPGPQVYTGMIFSWDHWDTNWYLLISRLGYFSKTSANFFPLYPATVGWVSWLFGHGSGPIWPQPDRLRLLVAIGLSNLALLVGLYAIARLAELDADPDDHRAGVRAAWILLAYPFAMAFTEPLAEGYLLAFAALALLLARQGCWYSAAVAAILAGLTRPVAVILVAPLLWEYARQHGWWRWPPGRPGLPSLRPLAMGAAVAVAAPLGMGIYFTYLYYRFGDFLLPLHDQLKIWGHASLLPWETVRLVVQNLASGVDTFLLPVEVGLIIGFGLITLVSIRRIPFAYTLYMAGLLYLVTAAPLTNFSDVLIGATRYLAGSIPVFLILARWSARRPWLQTGLISVGIMLQGAIMVAYFQNRLPA